MELDEDRWRHDNSRSRNSHERRDATEDEGDAYMEDSRREKDRSRESGRHKSSDRKKDRREGTDRDRERDREDHENDKDRISGKERKREQRDEKERGWSRGHRGDSVERSHEKDRPREKERNKERDVDKRGLEFEHERAKERVKERVRERDYEKERVSSRDYDRGKERVNDRGRERERDHDRGRGRDMDREEREKRRDYEWDDKAKEKGRDRGKERERDKREKDREKYKDKEKEFSRQDERTKSQTQESGKEDAGQNDDNIGRQKEADTENLTINGQNKGIQDVVTDVQDIAAPKDHHSAPSHLSALELQERIKKMKEERLRKKVDEASEIASWVNRSRHIEEKVKADKEKASIRLRTLEDDTVGESDDEDQPEGPEHTGKDLAGVKVLHGLDKVLEGGAVVLTLKDQNILADGDLNEDMDVLENIEIGEQKRRDQAYRAAKKAGMYEDKFGSETELQKSILPQYDDQIEDEGVSLDESGRFTGEAEKKLEELRKRIEGGTASRKFEDLTTTGKTSSDYYTVEEMLQFKKPKKKKSLRKKEKLDLDALEAEAKSAGLGSADLGSRKDGRRQSVKEQLEKAEVETRKDAYQLALAKAEEASKFLRLNQTLAAKVEDDNDAVFGDDYDDLQKSVEQARRLAMKKQDETFTSGPQAVALQALAKKEQVDTASPTGDQENKVVITEMEEFVLSLQLNEDTHKPEAEDVFMDEDPVLDTMEFETKDDDSGWTEPENVDKEEISTDVKEDVVLDETIHEVAVGKGLAGAVKLLKERGALKETVEWGGRTMDKKKSKLVGIHENAGPKEIHIERLDEFGRILTPKEAFRVLSHKFHGKGPGKMKQEKRMKQYQEELKLKQMKASDTPSQSVERMREAQVRLKTPYLVLSGHIKPGQTSDPRSGFGTVEKDLGSLTPMLGDRKVEHFLGIKRKDDRDVYGGMPPLPPKKPKS